MAESPEGPGVVLITAPDRETAARLARALVDERLAACVNLVPGIRSIYRWEGRVEEEDEVLLLAKTSRLHLDSLERRVRALHPYDVPELIFLSISGGSASYLAWLAKEASG